MAEAANTLPTKSESKSATPNRIARSFETWRNEMEHFFDDARKREPFGYGLFDRLSFGRMALSGSIPKIDIAEKENEYEVSAELPGMDEKDVEVTCSNGGLLIKGEKKEESEEKKKDYFLAERRYGAFERYFTIPDGVDASKITADFKKGVLTVTLPKTAEAKSQKRKIPVKAH